MNASLLVLLSSLALFGCGPASAPAPAPGKELGPAITLGGTDGDVWAFSLRTEGRVDPRRCIRVTVASPRAIVPAPIDGTRFAVTVPLDEGLNRVVARCHRRDGGPLRSPARLWSVRLRDTPRARIRVVAEDGVRLDGGASERSPVRDDPIVDWSWRAAADNPAPLVLTTGGGVEAARDARLLVATPARDGEYYVTLRVTDADGRSDESTTYFVVEDGVARAVDMETENPAWVDEAVVYGVVPFLFGDEPLEDVRGRLAELDALGVDTLWLSPVFEAPGDDYGYAVTGYFDVRPAYGTAEELGALVDDAHARGMRVVLDIVPNHTSDRHPYFVQAREEGRGSRYWPFYDRDREGRPTHYFDWEHLPNLDYDNPEVRRWMTEVGAYWIREHDVDGYRVDVAWGVRERAPEFWPDFRAEMKRIKPDILLLAEATARDRYYFREGFDAAYDWTKQLGRWAWLEAFQDGEVDLGALNEALTAELPEDALVFRFLDNNDTGPRFRTRHGPDLERPASLLLFTLPGLPSLFTGTEIGAELDPYQREEPLAWATASPVPHHARHIALRRAQPALRSRAFEPVPAAAAEPVYAYLRTCIGDTPECDSPLLVAINFGAGPTEARLLLPEGILPAHTRTLEDVLEGERVRVRGTRPLRLRLPAFSGRVLRLPPGSP